jgi:hypothetical protein
MMKRLGRAVHELLRVYDEQAERGDDLMAALLDVRLEGTEKHPCWCGKSQYPGADHQHECERARRVVNAWKAARK